MFEIPKHTHCSLHCDDGTQREAYIKNKNEVDRFANVVEKNVYLDVGDSLLWHCTHHTSLFFSHKF